MKHVVAPKTPEANGAAPQQAKRSSADREFLPAVLEILETPPSPIGTGLLLSICLLVSLALAWSWFGHFDIVATAVGRIQPTGRVKIVQPVETGQVTEVVVANGSKVKAGDPLIRLDAREAQSDVAAGSAMLAALTAEVQCRRAALEAVGSGTYAAPKIEWDSLIPVSIREREKLVLDADLARLSADLAALEAERVQKTANVARLDATIAAQQELISKQDVRVDMRTQLLQMAAGSRAQLLDAEEARQLQRVTLATQQGELIEARAALVVNAENRKRTLDAFVADEGQKLADAERQIDDLREKLNKSKMRLEQMTITAPITGTVTALSVYGLGQVVNAGEEILRIVPEGSRLELEAYMPNGEIGFVREGQPVIVKIDSFPYTRYGGVGGIVKRIARDAISSNELQQTLEAPTSAPRSSGTGGAQHMQNLVYPVTIELERQTISVDGQDIPLAAGMAAIAEIKTGNRRILEYVFSPLVDVGSRSLKER